MRIQLKLFLFILLSLYAFSSGYSQNKIKSYTLEPIPSWVKNYPKPTLEEEYYINLPILQIETQYNHTTGELYNRVYYYLKNINAVNKIKYYSFEYEPDYKTVSIHKTTIHRGKQQISLGDQLHVEFLQEGKQINGENYDVDGKVIIFFDRTQVGDILEIAYSRKGFQPDLHNKLFFEGSLTLDNLRGSAIFRILGAKNKPFQFVALNTTKKPTVRTNNGIMSLEYIHDSDDYPEEINAPSWHQLHPKIHITGLESWNEYLELNLINFQLEKNPTSEIVQKTNTIVNKNDTKAQQINTILNYVQKEIEYLEYDKIEPKRPETVLSQGFGDCKSKSLLTIKMLEAIDVEAWPVIVNSNGFDNRLLNLPEHAFDHCVLEFVHKGDTILFDATRDIQRGTIYEKYNNDFRYGFRVKKGTNKLTKLTQNNYNNRDLEVIIHTRKEGSFGIGNTIFNNYVTKQITYSGEIANNYIAVYNKYGIDNFIQNINDEMFNNYWDGKLLDFTYEEDEPKAILKINEHDSNDRYFDINYKKEIAEFKPFLLVNLLIIIGDKPSAPVFSLPDFGKTTQTYKFIHDGGAKIVEDSLVYEKDWIKFSKKITHQNDTLIATYTAEILKKELSSDRYNDVTNDIDFIKKATVIKFDEPKTVYKKRVRSIRHYVYSYVIPIVFLGIIILIIVCIVKYIKRKKQVKRLKAEIASLKDELKQYQTD